MFSHYYVYILYKNNMHTQLTTIQQTTRQKTQLMNFSFAVIFPNMSKECANDHLDLVWMNVWICDSYRWNFGTLLSGSVWGQFRLMKDLYEESVPAFVALPFSRYFNPAYSIFFLDIDEDNPVSKCLCSYMILWNPYIMQQVGDDKTIKQWNMEAPGYGVREEPINTILGKVQFYLTHIIYIIIKSRNGCIYLNKNKLIL